MSYNLNRVKMLATVKLQQMYGILEDRELEIPKITKTISEPTIAMVDSMLSASRPDKPEYNELDIVYALSMIIILELKDSIFTDIGSKSFDAEEASVGALFMVINQVYTILFAQEMDKTVLDVFEEVTGFTGFTGPL